MTKTDIENLINILEDYAPKEHYAIVSHGSQKEVAFVRWEDVCRVLRDLAVAVEDEKISGPNYEALYAKCTEELEKTRAQVESLKFDMHHLAIENAHYAGAVAAMETIFGRKFEPRK